MCNLPSNSTNNNINNNINNNNIYKLDFLRNNTIKQTGINKE